MKRYLCWLAVLGVAVVPDWASAFHRCGYPPPPCGYGPPPVAYYPPQLVFVPPYVPAYEVPLPPPRVYATPVALAPARPAPTRPANPPVVTPKPAAAPASGGVTNAGGLTLPGLPGPVVSPEPQFRPAAAEPVRPAAVTNPPPPVITPDPPMNPTPPAGKLPELPSAVPSPAPPLTDPGTLIPPAAPPVPVGPDAKKPTGPGGSLPPLVLPPEGGPGTTSRSSPLSAVPKPRLSVRVFPAAGTGAGKAGTRKVGFFNHTGRDLDLVIEGKAVKLPGKTYIHAEVPPSFTWRYGDNPAQSATVPAGTAGLDVVFRE